MHFSQGKVKIDVHLFLLHTKKISFKSKLLQKNKFMKANSKEFQRKGNTRKIF